MSMDDSDDTFDGDSTDAVVIDNGSWNMKIGIAGNDVPHQTFRANVGYPKFSRGQIESTLKDFFDDEIVGQTLYSFIELQSHYIGKEEQELFKSGILRRNSPFFNKNIKNWDEVSLLWEASWDLLKLAPTDRAILLTEPWDNSKASRERMTEIMFEKFGVPGLYVSPPCLLSLYASGRTTGAVIDFGHSKTDITPIYEGYTVPHAIQSNPVGGHDLTIFLQSELHDFSLDYETAATIKETCVFAPDSSLDDDTLFKLPDGKLVEVSSQIKQRCIDKLSLPSVCESLLNSIRKTNDARDYYNNIVLMGAGSKIPDITESISSGILGKGGINAKVIAPPERHLSAWIGGSILASLSPFKEMWVNQLEYMETGPEIVNRKCY